MVFVNIHEMIGIHVGISIVEKQLKLPKCNALFCDAFFGAKKSNDCEFHWFLTIFFSALTGIPATIIFVSVLFDNPIY